MTGPTVRPSVRDTATRFLQALLLLIRLLIVYDCLKGMKKWAVNRRPPRPGAKCHMAQAEKGRRLRWSVPPQIASPTWTSREWMAGEVKENEGKPIILFWKHFNKLNIKQPMNR